MESVSNKIPSGITVDIESAPKMSSSSSSDGFFSTDGKTSYMRIGLIVVILLFLGVNIFTYLGDFLQVVKEALAPLLKNILEKLQNKHTYKKHFQTSYQKLGLIINVYYSNVWYVVMNLKSNIY